MAIPSTVDEKLSGLVEGTSHGERGAGYSERYSKEFKRKAVRMLEAGDRSGKQIERDLGIGSGNVNKWRRELKASVEQVFPINGMPRDEELVTPRKEVASFREYRVEEIVLNLGVTRNG